MEDDLNCLKNGRHTQNVQKWKMTSIFPKKTTKIISKIKDYLYLEKLQNGGEI